MAIDFKHTTLDNGLTVIAEVNPDAHTAATGFFCKVGTRDEDKALEGVSHFLEHMMFKGTPRRTADDVNREFDEMGANYNAFTSHEQTVYYAQVLPEFLPRAVDLLGDMLRPSLREDDFTMEKNVILEEIGMYADRPTWRLQDDLLEKHYGSHPLGFRVLGTNESIKALTAEQMRGYFEHRYSPDNIVVSVAGNVDFDAFVSDVERLTRSWTATGVERVYEPPKPGGGDVTMRDARVNRHYLGLMIPGPSAQDTQRYAAKVLADVLGDSDGSRIYWALVDPGLAEEADFSFLPFDRSGAYMGYASCDPKDAEKVEQVLLETIDGLAGSVTEDEMERAKNKLATTATLQGENPGGRMRRLGMQWLYLAEYNPLEEELAKLQAVTIEEIEAVLKQQPLDQRTIVRLTPEK